MPRIDSGSYIVEVHTILGLRDPSKILDWALTEAQLVTSPALVYVRSPRIRLTVGVGSLVSETEPPIRYYRVASPQWIDTCKPSTEPVYTVKEGDIMVEGVVVAIEYRDPAALLLNGIKGVHTVSGEAGEGYAVVGNYKVLDWSRDEGYTIHVSSGEAYRRASYIAPIASTCNMRR